MPKLNYPCIIAGDDNYRTLADVGMRVQALPVDSIVTTLTLLVDTVHLPLLATKWGLEDIEGWALAVAEEQKRSLIAKAAELHRRKGTPWAIREIVRTLGFGEVELIEGLGGERYSGDIAYDGTYVHGDSELWAHYNVVLKQAITQTQAALLIKALEHFAPARCRLNLLDYRRAAIQYDGKAYFSGDYRYGTI